MTKSLFLAQTSDWRGLIWHCFSVGQSSHLAGKHLWNQTLIASGEGTWPAILHEQLSGTSSSPENRGFWSNFGSQQGLKEGREITHQEVPKAIFTLSGFTPTCVGLLVWCMSQFSAGLLTKARNNSFWVEIPWFKTMSDMVSEIYCKNKSGYFLLCGENTLTLNLFQSH